MYIHTQFECYVVWNYKGVPQTFPFIGYPSSVSYRDSWITKKFKSNVLLRRQLDVALMKRLVCIALKKGKQLNAIHNKGNWFSCLPSSHLQGSLSAYKDRLRNNPHTLYKLFSFL